MPNKRKYRTGHLKGSHIVHKYMRNDFWRNPSNNFWRQEEISGFDFVSRGPDSNIISVIESRESRRYSPKAKEYLNEFVSNL